MRSDRCFPGFSFIGSSPWGNSLLQGNFLTKLRCRHCLADTTSGINYAQRVKLCNEMYKEDSKIKALLSVLHLCLLESCVTVLLNLAILNKMPFFVVVNLKLALSCSTRWEGLTPGSQESIVQWTWHVLVKYQGTCMKPKSSESMLDMPLV